MEFKIIKKSKRSRARLGLLKTQNGVVETPCFVPVATQAVVKTLTSEEAEQAKCQILIANTFHLHLKPGENIVKKSGGLHKFMNWQRPLMTDSGGFQVFSLGFGKDLGTGKILNAHNANIKLIDADESIRSGNQPKEVKITKDGVYFNSPVDGRKLFLGPKESIKIQEDLGADIIFSFDECPPPSADYKYVKGSLLKTHEWAKICLKVKKSRQTLFGIVQGGRYKDLRMESAKFIASLDFDGFGIGGEFGSDKKQMVAMLHQTVKELPDEKPRHLLGIGYLKDMESVIKQGIDSFDCTIPTHYARRGMAFINLKNPVKIDLSKKSFLNNKNPLDKNCGCFVCQEYKINYITHLFRAKEITALKLLTFHNLYFFNTFVEKIREKIKKGKL
ncbi:MAG: hypothetical protein A3H01_00850 [Candidatus Wildermuthbacteria bacterium RIFCSPLOWO2_12_FULL_40_9]|uniref:Queuine tRNA-ribosyltransferase n=1 Tax=Candidatus Wildermuthbacteria bacterium RIFCSPLOWO2_12_FULL_40_9 TaxID=1802467 RepID=A0A1G2RVE2_9BACT|nr:MAG: hypothetical protein A3H01_00850 [Candidatus Wildermuthbacteria bacterium RIFCSPLOWO2_12_FULL_40_9]